MAAGKSLVASTYPAFYLCLAGELPVVLSTDYRLASEHRFPAALDDSTIVLSLVRGQVATAKDADPWLVESTDFGRVFVSDESVTRNIVHVAIHQGSCQLTLDPVRFVGYAMLCPLFGRVQRMTPTMECPSGLFLTLFIYDQTWRLALPPGSTRDHPLVLVVAAERDRAVDYVMRLKAMGKPVEFEEQHHRFFVIEPFGDTESEVVRAVKLLIYDNDGDCAVSNGIGDRDVSRCIAALLLSCQPHGLI